MCKFSYFMQANRRNSPTVELILSNIKALKTLVWHFSKEPMKEINSLKRNKQVGMYDEQGQTNKAKDKQSQERIYLGDELRQVAKVWCIIAPVERYSGYRYFQ